MKWYKIKTEFQHYKWGLFALFLIPFCWGAVCNIVGLNARTPVLIFTGMLVIWCALWIIATVSYKRMK